MITSSRKCAFCNRELGSKDSVLRESREHIFRRQTLIELGLLKAQFRLQVFSNNHQYKWVQPVGNTFLASGICQDCNGGWMNTIDERAEPVKLALARGEITLDEVSHADREALAVWVAKASYATIAMGMNHLKVDPHYLHSFFADPTLPKNSAVLLNPIKFGGEASLGHSFNAFWDIRTLHTGLFATPGLPGYKLGFRLGELEIGFIHITAPFFEIDAPIISKLVASNGPVRRRYEHLFIEEERMPFTGLNDLMCNLSCRHRDLLPSYVIDGKKGATIKAVCSMEDYLEQINRSRAVSVTRDIHRFSTSQLS